MFAFVFVGFFAVILIGSMVLTVMAWRNQRRGPV